MTMRISTAARNAAADGVVDRLEDGTGVPAVLQLRSGARPTNLTDADTGTLLAEFNGFQDPAFGAAAAGVATLLGVPFTEVGLAAGTVGHARVYDQGGVIVWDTDSVGTSGTEIVLNTLTISIGVNVELTAWTVTMPAS